MLLAQISNALTWVLILFPLLSGGIWIHTPALKAELSELAIPTLLTAVFWIFAWRSNPTACATQSSVRLTLKAWCTWTNELKTHPKLALSLGTLVAFSLLALASIREHHAFETHSYDVGIFVNTLWNWVNGLGYFSSIKFETTLLADHFTPTLWLIGPLYSLFPRAETLLVIQALVIAAGGVPLYFIATRYLKAASWFAPAVPLLYWAYLPLRNANRFEFHPEVAAPFLAFYAIYLLETLPAETKSLFRTRLLGFVMLLLMLGLKESLGPVLVGMGLCWWFGGGRVELAPRYRKQLGLSIAGLGTMVFFLVILLTPMLVGKSYEYESVYAHLGKSLPEILASPILRPVEFWSSFFGWSRIRFMVALLAPLAFLPLLAWRPLLATLPALALLFVGQGDLRVSPQFHYACEPAIGIFWALTHLGYSRFTNFGLSPVRFGLGVLLFALVFFGRSELYAARIAAPTPHEVWIQNEVLPCIHPSAPLTASTTLVPWLGARHWIHHAPIVQGKTARAECVVFDPSLDAWPMDPSTYVEFENRLPAQGYVREWTCKGLSIYKHQEFQGSCMACAPQCVPADTGQTPHLSR